MKIKKHLFKLLALVLMSSVTACSSKIEPYGVLPTAHQLAWQDMEYYMFIHFGPNTFTDVEWGDGKEDPKVFNPTDMNTDQWALIAKDAGMKGIIITAKHHDGFCLWPSQYSKHTVRESPWKDGKGDVLQELSESCKKYGLKFGVYLSPWDQNHPAYGTPSYNEVFANTLEEVLTNYGEVFEQWFDGATDGTSKQVYDWDLFHKVVYKHQPQAIIFSDIGPGCRWIGNERGIVGETNWSRLNVEGYTPGHGAPSTDVLNEGVKDGALWVPGEADVSIRPGWFYSPATDDKVKSVEQLMDIYYGSVGRNANLLLNVPPDRRGRIHPNDSIRLMEFRKARELVFNKNLITSDVSVTASNVREGKDQYAPHQIFDGKMDTYWVVDDGSETASLELTFREAIEFDHVLLQEYIALGQRVESFSVKAWSEDLGEFVLVAEGTTIGYKRILHTKPTVTSKVQINITGSLAVPLINNLELYRTPDEYQLLVYGKNYHSRIIDGKQTLKEDGSKINLAKKEEGIILGLDKSYLLKGFRFTPTPSEKDVTIQRYNFYVKTDGGEWKKIISNGIFNNIKNNPIEQHVMLYEPVEASHIMIEPVQLTDVKADSYTYLDVDVIM